MSFKKKKKEFFLKTRKFGGYVKTVKTVNGLQIRDQRFKIHSKLWVSFLAQGTFFVGLLLKT